ncbi:MAG: DUF3857 domain-containing protein [Cytophagaceae bacterium]|nr:DUF3857 domain-containing protein [Cytophagaceae bacterium]
MIRSIFIFFALLIINAYSTLSAEPEKYDWMQDRKKFTITAADEKKPVIILQDKRVMEYVIEDFDGRKALVVYRTHHKIILVNTDESIEKFNKVFVQTDGPNSIVSIKARSINKNGKVVNLDKNSFKELENVEGIGAFKIFAIEGLEPESEIEYIYTVKKKVSGFYGREYYQSQYPVWNASFDLISPEHLEFEVKGYNGLPDLADTIYNEKRYVSFKVDSIPAAVEEEYAVYDANLKRLDYKLSYNTSQGRVRMQTWAEAAQNIFNNVCVFSKKTEIPKIKKLCKAQKFYTLADDEAKIKAVENYIKTNFEIKQGSSADYVMLDKVISNKYANETGILRLFEAIYTELNIDHRLVLTSSRDDAKFDGKFETYRYLEQSMLYFPASNKYLAPDQMEYRYGMVPFYWTNNEGLFIKRVTIGEAETSVSEVKFIPPLPSHSSIDNIYATINFSPDFEAAVVNARREIGGYNAVNFQPVYSRLDAEKKTMLNDQLMDFISKDAEITNISVENTDPNQSPIEKPFIIKGDIKVTTLIEKAGNKYFFKVGDVIGKQSELYSDKKRVNPVENDFNRVYIRQIKVKIPQGYTVKNLDDLKKDVTFDQDGKKTMGFVSTYKVQGDMIIVDINEYYNQIDVSLNRFEEFRKVINAAADFNKIVLILEKTN